ncbi:MAG: TetR/AcrR family transcriptional regulator [Woeseiaceae bacterium]|nr:TetR/AcrR family transcriptional regulator [Woeseiaceae bacterium]
MAKKTLKRSAAKARKQAGKPRSARGQNRRAKILDAAAELFLDHGFGETSIDAIVERSGGSKATLYSYFPTKEDLFHAVVDDIVSNKQPPALESGDDLRTALISFALQRMKVVFSSQHRLLLRLIVAERDRFPAIAAMYYEYGPQRSHDLLVDYMGQLKTLGLLAIDNAEESAEFLIGMLLHQWYLVQLYLQAPPPSESAMRNRATHVVDRFLEAFGWPEIAHAGSATRRARSGTHTRSTTKK